MTDYLKIFDTAVELLAYHNDDPITPVVSFSIDLELVMYKSAPPDYSELYFTIKALESGTVSFTILDDLNISDILSISYSINGGTSWTTITNSDNKSESIVTSIQVNSGTEIIWKSVGTGTYGSYFSSTCNCNVYGNLLSLIYGDLFVGLTILPEDMEYLFEGLFSDDWYDLGHCQIIDASNLIFPSNTLRYCYYNMFLNCTELLYAPKILPAITLSENCYYGMFEGCSSLITPPELSATTLAKYCCYDMFKNCTSLTTSPILLAEILVNYCYNYMFYGCSSLNYITAYFLTKPSSSYTNYWVRNVAANGTFVRHGLADWTYQSGISTIPSGWTVLTDNNYILSTIVPFYYNYQSDDTIAALYIAENTNSTTINHIDDPGFGTPAEYITNMYVDGVEVPVSKLYSFASTGVHLVLYKCSSSFTEFSEMFYNASTDGIQLLALMLPRQMTLSRGCFYLIPPRWFIVLNSSNNNYDPYGNLGGYSSYLVLHLSTPPSEFYGNSTVVVPDNSVTAYAAAWSNHTNVKGITEVLGTQQSN